MQIHWMYNTGFYKKNSLVYLLMLNTSLSNRQKEPQITYIIRKFVLGKRYIQGQTEHLEFYKYKSYHEEQIGSCSVYDFMQWM